MNGNADPFQEQQPQVAAQLAQLQRKVQHYLDKTTPFIAYRWIALAAVTLTYALRVYYLRGFYIVTYALGIYNLNLLLGFLSPQIDPELEAPTLPSKRDDEFQPFMRRLPEYKFWYGFVPLRDNIHVFRRLSSMKSLLLGMGATFFQAFDVPVFWPILLIYWFVLFTVTMKRQIKHMIKYRYVPFSFGKKVRVLGVCDDDKYCS